MKEFVPVHIVANGHGIKEVLILQEVRDVRSQ